MLTHLLQNDDGAALVELELHADETRDADGDALNAALSTRDEMGGDFSEAVHAGSRTLRAHQRVHSERWKELVRAVQIGNSENRAVLFAMLVDIVPSPGRGRRPHRYIASETPRFVVRVQGRKRVGCCA